MPPRRKGGTPSPRWRPRFGVDRAGQRHWPAAPVDAFGCFGHGGKRAMVVLPGLDLIVSWNDTGIDGREAENRALELLLAAAAE